MDEQEFIVWRRGFCSKGGAVTVLGSIAEFQISFKFGKVMLLRILLGLNYRWGRLLGQVSLDEIVSFTEGRRASVWRSRKCRDRGNFHELFLILNVLIEGQSCSAFYQGVGKFGRMF